MYVKSSVTVQLEKNDDGDDDNDGKFGDKKKKKT